MKDLMVDEAETCVNSPDKQFRLSAQRPAPSPAHLLHPWGTHHPDHQLSLTEQHLHSRGIVREVLRTHQHKTIKHDIHRIHHEAALYASPKPAIAAELNFSSIPPRNKLYSSVCSAKIHRISTAMASVHQNKPALAHNQPDKASPAKHPATPNPTNPPAKQNISVSGLVTYKFSSVTAQRALGIGQIDRLQDMYSELSSIKQKRECSRAREKAILLRGSRRRYARMAQTEQDILCDSGVSTERYLSGLVQKQRENAILYNERANKLRYVHELMREDNLPYEEAHHIVQKIEDIHAEQEAEVEQARKAQAEVDEEEEIRRRLVSRRKERVMVRYQTFVD